MFRPLANNLPFLKMAFQGFAGDGKTYTAALVAIGVHKLIQSDKPIAIFDTEQAAKALQPFFELEGIEAVVNDQDKSLAALTAAIQWCEGGGSDVLIIDSITHVWESFKSAYMQSKPKNKTFLEMQDWNTIKPRWREGFSMPFVNAKCHIIFTGRAGFEYSDEKNEDTGKREIFKSGIKMKAESETAFEPDILVLMENEMDVLGPEKRVYRTATVLKDRSTKIDGMIINADGSKRGPTFEDFYPAVASLLSGKLVTYTGGTIPDRFEDWQSKWDKTRFERENILNEMDGHFKLMGIGTGAADQKMKAATLKNIFGVTSTDNLGGVPMEKLREGWATFQVFAEKYVGYLEELVDQGRAAENGKTPPVDYDHVKRLLKEAQEMTNPELDL